MACKLGGLFSLDEDFDDEDVLGTDWTTCAPLDPTTETTWKLRASSAAVQEQETLTHQRNTDEPLSFPSGTASRDGPQTPAVGLRRLCTPLQSLPVAPTNPQLNLTVQQSQKSAGSVLKSSTVRSLDDFDDWDVDLADLDEWDSQVKQQPQPLPQQATPILSTSLRPSIQARMGSPALPTRPQMQLDKTCSTFSSSCSPAPSRTLLSPSFPPRPPQSSAVLTSPSAASPAPSTFSRTLANARQTHSALVTPRSAPQSRGLFETTSPAPSAPARSPSLSHPLLRTPVLTNRLVQLVSASSKLPVKRPSSGSRQLRTRRFPGPAGLLPQQPHTQNLDEIVVSVPQTPTHGALARPPSQPFCSQTEEDEFGAGGWATMKREMGLDERNPSCFLHSYSVVMVLRKAALKQLWRNKVPNMAVLLKSIIHTSADAKAVFKDPTGEIQGTVHRRLLEERAQELQVGAVLLLKQVGVFSPSHRNHYLNVTPNNLLRVYGPDGGVVSSLQLPPLVPEEASPPRGTPARRGPVSQMQLVFDEEDDEGTDCWRCSETAGEAPVQTSRGNRSPSGSGRAPPGGTEDLAPRDADWEADDDLDELLGELPEDACGL